MARGRLQLAPGSCYGRAMTDEPFRPISVKSAAELLVERRLVRARTDRQSARTKAEENRREGAVLTDRIEQLGERISELEEILEAVRDGEEASE